MKRSNTIYSLITLLIMTLLLANNVEAQSDGSKEASREAEIQRTIEEHKRQLIEQAKAERESAQEQAKMLEKQAEEMQREAFEHSREFQPGSPEFFEHWEEYGKRMADTYKKMVPDSATMSMWRDPRWGNQGDRWRQFSIDDREFSDYTFSKSLKSSDFTQEDTFTVSPSSRSVNISLHGRCNEGQIAVTIIAPDGSVYLEALPSEIDSFNIRRMIKITDTENLDKVGDFVIKITCTKATGFFILSMQAA